MFYCETDKNLNSWPGVIPTSYGRCEVCNMVTACFDYPVRMLKSPDADNILKDIVDDGE